MAHTRDIIDFVEFFQEILPKSLASFLKSYANGTME